MGYGVILIMVAFFRELFGSGTILNYHVVPEFWWLSSSSGWYVNNGLMLLAPGAFIILGLIIWVQRTFTKYVEE